MRIISGFSITFISLLLVQDIGAQNERRDSRAIGMIKRVQVSRLDKRLPAISFSGWFGNVIGKSQRIEWEINDCGEQDGSGRQKDFPICVQASSTSGRVEVTVMIAAGTHKRGIIGTPAVWGIWVGRKGEVSKIFDDLTDLALELKRLRQLQT